MYLYREESSLKKRKEIIVIIAIIIIISGGVLNPTATRDRKQAAFIEYTPVTMVTHTDINTDLHSS